MRKKKRGSTFMVVVIVMAIIFTTGTTVLALTASNYKMRINESKRLQNLYEADSGLDVVKNIIIKTSQEAIKYADKEVKKELMNSSDENKEDINNLFKEKFYKFLSENDNGSMELLQYLILNKKIITSVSDNGTIDTTNLKNVSENKNYTIEIPEGGYKVKENNGKVEGITIAVKSTFETVNEELKNKRTVSTEFEITAPEYESVVSVVDIYPVFDGKAITADGDMNVNGDNDGFSLSISGDIWIKGNGETISDENPIFTFSKYNGGINLNNTKFNIDGNIYTANTFTLNSDVKEKSEVNGNIYAQNVYIGKTLKEYEANNYIEIGSSNNNMIFNGNVIVNNDLAMNTTNSNITINNNFYGINDKTIEKIDEDSGVNEVLNSSSIIVNESENSTLTVQGDSYILGVAYLNATNSEGKKYQTGESVAVKGNYLAYTDVEGVLNGDENITLRYYAPLQLLETFKGESTADSKAEYFIEYYSNEDNNNYKYKDGGVILGTESDSKVISAGAVKNGKGEFQASSVIKKEDSEIIESEKNEYARNVFAMGDTTNLGDKIYENQKVLRTVENEIIFDNMKTVQTINKDKRGFILNSSESEIIIDNEDIIKSGLIISKGNIVIKGKFNFTGTIITLGNIIFEGNEDKNIKYDAGVVRNVIAENYDDFKDIFNENSSKGTEVKVSSSSDIYNSDKFLTESLWKIER